MSLTSAMRSLRMDIDNGHKIRQDYIRSLKKSTDNMIDNYGKQRIKNSLEDKKRRLLKLNELKAYGKQRIKNSLEDKKQRMLDFNELKTEVNNMKNCFGESRKSMSDNTKQTLNCFVNSLKNDVCSLLGAFRQDRADARKEWDNVKKKV